MKQRAALGRTFELLLRVQIDLLRLSDLLDDLLDDNSIVLADVAVSGQGCGEVSFDASSTIRKSKKKRHTKV